MLLGRLGLDSAKVPHKDRAGLLYLARGALTARDGTLAFMQGEATRADALGPGDYAISASRRLYDPARPRLHRKP